MSEINFEILQKMIDKKIFPIVTFTENFDDLETQFERGMLATIENIKKVNEEEYQIWFDETDFAKFNKELEVPAWYNDENGECDLKFSERYKRKNDVCLSFYFADDLSYYLTLKENTAYAELIKEYQESNSKLNYMDWLQEQVLMLRALTD